MQLSDLSSLWSLILLCALAFIPAGSLLSRYRTALMRAVRWMLIGRRRIRRAHSVEALLQREERRK